MAPLSSTLKAIYYGNSVGALRGPTALFEQAKRMRVKGVTLKKVQDWLAGQPEYSLYRPARRRYRRNPVEANSPGECVQVDIMDLQLLGAVNENLYVLLAYDTFSKFLSMVKLRNREAGTVCAALEELIDSSPFPWLSIYWDKEGAFLSRQVQTMLTRRGIHNYTTKALVKAPGVERSIRTLRQLLQRRLDASGSLRWERELPKIVNGYNRRRHSTTRLTPLTLVEAPWRIVDTYDAKRLEQPGKEAADRRLHRRLVAALPAIGSLVRLNRLRGAFGKEASGTWTEELFRVIRHNTTRTIPLVYVEDLRGQEIFGGLYPEEIQPVKWSGKRRPLKIVRERTVPVGGRRRVKEYLIRWRGWPPAFDEWVRRRPPGL